MSNSDEMEPPRNRPTDPDLNRSDRDLLESMERSLHDMAGTIRDLAFNVAAALEQGQTNGQRITALETRVGRLENRGNGSEHPVPA